ncbi:MULTISPECIES: hypothetical protein [Nostocales]|uniref:hypothetical protein n=1 Tax=Nostocales TaxID=1161 RepID=UPI00051303F2
MLRTTGRATIDDSQLQTKKSQIQGNIQQNQLQLTQIAAQPNALQIQRDSESRLMNRPSDKFDEL